MSKRKHSPSSWLLLATVVLVSAGGAFCREEENGEDDHEVVRYDDYKLIKMSPGQQHDREKLKEFLESKMVDFWTNPLAPELDADFMVAPQHFKDVVEFLKTQQVPYKLMLDNVQYYIDQQQNPTDDDDDEEEEEEQSGGGGGVNNQQNDIPEEKRIKEEILSRGKRGIFRDFLHQLMRPTILGSMMWRQRQRRLHMKQLRNRQARLHRVAQQQQQQQLLQDASDSNRIPRRIKPADDFVASTSNETASNEIFDSGLQTMSWSRYHRVGDINAWLRGLALEQPDLVETFEIGVTAEGRDILVAKVGKKQNFKKPAVFIEAGIHAREWISPATATYVIKSLVEDREANADLTNFFDFYILPVANPDGYEYSHTKNRFWRKNRGSGSKMLSTLFADCKGVDLNRNFGFRWGESDAAHVKGGTSLPCAETYEGPRKWSEPESRAIADFIMARKDDFAVYLSLHSYGEKVVYPWSYTAKPLEDWRQLHRVAVQMADAMHDASRGRSRFSVGTAPGIQYQTNGCTGDWARGEAGIKWVFLIELPDRGFHGFLLPAGLIVPTARATMAGVRAAAVAAAENIVR